MPYTAEISRNNPSCILFLIDQSGSMSDPFGNGEVSERKADGLATAINKLLQNLCVKCAKEEGVRDYFHVGVIGYGSHAGIGPAFRGVLSGRDLVPISEVALNPARVDERAKKVSDGAGGLVEQTVKFPIWIDPVADNGTPMCAAFERSHEIIRRWADQHSNSFPPVVINITDGESGDGDPTGIAENVRAVSTNDGEALLFNLHLSTTKAAPIEFPSQSESLPDQHARLLYGLSSFLPPHMLTAAQQEGYQIQPEARGFAFNADLVATIKFLDIGTRPSNLR